MPEWQRARIDQLSREQVARLRKMRDEQIPVTLKLEDGEEVAALIIAVGRAKQFGPGYHLVWEPIRRQ